MTQGEALRNIFENHILKINGADMTIYKNFATDRMESMSSRVIKEGSKFLMAASTDIESGDVFQIEGSKSLLRIVDIEEEMAMGTLHHLIVSATKIDQLGNEIGFNNEGNAVFNAPVYGGVQVGGSGNAQNINLSNSDPQLLNAFTELAKIAAGTSELDKEEILTELDYLKRLVEKEKTPDVLEKMQKRMNLLKTAVETAGLVSAAGPHIEYILRSLGLH